MSESKSFVRSGIIFLSIALVVNGMFSLALFSTVQTRTHHSISYPDWDSGWVSISPGQTLTFWHNLGTIDLLVYVMGNTSYSGYEGIHQINYGGTGSGWGGLSWKGLTENTISVQRQSSDGYWWEKVRVMIWKMVQNLE